VKIYTKTGDKGETSLIGGTRVPKYHDRIEAYGTVDELNSWIGQLADECADESYVNFLRDVQDRLFTIGSNLAMDPDKPSFKLPEINETDVLKLENAIDNMNESLPELRNFILPGGHPVVSRIHISRCVCRRAERCVIKVADNAPVNDIIIRFLNRLSDFLFVFARYSAKLLNANEINWKPNS
jgi:cob(I)alamin adenosyltransferase